ncbi:CHY zinc finger protein [Leuconostocaceae bacterium ESL0958]|nr:CHY zinc finger protein [Leuconostocaceae bacterium ESL0958]
MARIPVIFGLNLQGNGGCRHYHTERDVLALQCAHCQRYYACYHCHDALADHPFAASSKAQGQPLLCGRCQQKLTYRAYQQGACPHCRAAFNPNCARHAQIYFC